jgi:hypothetical protein
MTDWWSFIGWTNLILVVAAGFALLTLWRWTSDKRNVYDVRDLLLDHKTNRASLDKHVVAWFSGLSGWVIVTWTLEGKNVETMLLGILAIFIVQRTANKVTDVMAARNITPEGSDASLRTLERK